MLEFIYHFSNIIIHSIVYNLVLKPCGDEPNKEDITQVKGLGDKIRRSVLALGCICSLYLKYIFDIFKNIK
jgi:hypothetical protein